MEAGRSGSFRVFRSRDYRYLWAGTALIFMAHIIAMVIQSVVAYDITGTNRSVGVMALCLGAAIAVGSPLGGVVADRVSARLVLVVVQVIFAAILLLHAVLISTGAMTIPVLAALTVGLGLTFCFAMPARQAWVSGLLPANEVPDGAAQQQLAMTVMGLGAPFIGGMLMVPPWLGITGTYVVMAACVVFATVLVVLTNGESIPAQGQRSPFAEMRLGLSHVLKRRRLAILIGAYVGVLLAGSAYPVVLPGILENDLGRDAGELTWMLTMSGIGGLVATAYISTRPVVKQTSTVLAVGGVALGVGLGLVGVSGSFLAAMLAMLVVGAGIGTVTLLNTVLAMREADVAYYGRVSSLLVLAFGLKGAGGLALGIMADAAGGRATMVFMGVAAAGVAGLMWIALRSAPAPTSRPNDHDPAPRIATSTPAPR